MDVLVWLVWKRGGRASSKQQQPGTSPRVREMIRKEQEVNLN